jgi:hypothetical protein
MPGAPGTPLDRFVRALHRRLLLLRLLEATGLGALAGCAVGGILIPLLLWRGVSAMPPTLVALFVGAAGGMTWSLARRPSPLQAAVEADRQLHLADLLATAVTVAPRPRESDRDADAAPWLQAVIAAADEACRRHAPSQVILHRLGGRAWGGIALAASLVLTVAALTTQEPAARASLGPSPLVRRGNGPTTHVTEGMQQAATAARAPQRSRSPGAGPESEGNRPPAGGVSNTDDSPGAAASDGGRSTGSPDDAGSGGGTGRARTPSENPLLPPAAPSPASPQAGSLPGTGGAGGSATRPAEGGRASGGTVAPDGARTHKPVPWESPAWPDDGRRAGEAIQSGQVPDARRDLVRDYFERP